MDIFEAIHGRRSIRRFTKKKIEYEKIEKIISAAISAPSACNIQGWKFIVITDQKIKEKLINTGTIEFIRYAPIGILVLYDNRSENPEYFDYIQSASAAIQNMLLAAYALGIGSCWICHLSPKKIIRKLLGIPGHYDPIAYVALGYYKKKPNPLPRRYSSNQVISFNKFNFKDSKVTRTTIYRFMRKMAFRLYKFVPFKKLFLPITKGFERFN